MNDRRLSLMSWSVLALAVIVIALWWTPCHAQSTGAPLLSFQRVSIGIGGDWTAYRPGDEERFRAVLPVSYNLGRYVSLTGRAAVELDPPDGQERVKEYSVGFVIHLLARGKTP